jgi:hypothetical protein
MAIEGAVVMVWLVLLNAFACGANLSLAVWGAAERDWRQVQWRLFGAAVSGILACALAVRA